MPPTTLRQAAAARFCANFVAIVSGLENPHPVCELGANRWVRDQERASQGEEPMVEGLGSRDRPLRVAIVGSGPAGFYAAEWLFRNKELVIEVDLFERLAAPVGVGCFLGVPDP